MDYLKDWTESELLNRVSWEQSLADMSEYHQQQSEQADELRHNALMGRI